MVTEFVVDPTVSTTVQETFNPFTGKATLTNWQTPRGLFDYLDRIYRFKVDAAADESNRLCEKWYGPGHDASNASFFVEGDWDYYNDALGVHAWASPAWCNPPYGKGVKDWLGKFREQQLLGNTVVALLPSRTGTQWWARGIVPFASIIFLTGRVPFAMGEGGPGSPEGKKSQPDHESAIVIYNPLPPAPPRWWDWRKDCYAK